MTLTEYSNLCHADNMKWWQNIDTGAPLKRNKGELLALIHTEINECYEGECDGVNDDKLPHRPMGEVELVDGIIRTFDYAAGFGYDLNRAGLKIGVSEFIDLNHLGKCVQMASFERERIKLSGPHAIALIHSKISRVVEHERKCRESEAELGLVEIIAAIAFYGTCRGYDLQGAFVEKREYNRTRKDHAHEARRIAGGKQF